MPSKYSVRPDNQTKTAQARASDLRVHFKNTREAAQSIKDLPLRKAQRFLRDVLRHRQTVPFRRYSGGVGRSAQAKMHKCATQSRWPQKSVRILLSLLRNAQSNAESKGLDIAKLRVSHVQVNRARQGRRRTYRAHGRIGPYMSHPCHVELILVEREAPVPKPVAEKPAEKKPAATKTVAAKQ